MFISERASFRDKTARKIGAHIYLSTVPDVTTVVELALRKAGASFPPPLVEAATPAAAVGPSDPAVSIVSTTD